MVTVIRELADRVPAKGTPNHRLFEPSAVTNLPVIDNSDRFSSNITTSIDCYVSGQYFSKGGKTIEVNQRYMVFVSYNKDTQSDTMKQVRDRVMSDFQDKYGSQFNISNVYIPNLPIPQDKVVPGVPGGGDESIEFYLGSRLAKEMTRYEKMRFDIGSEHAKASTNIGSLRKRYGYK